MSVAPLDRMLSPEVFGEEVDSDDEEFDMQGLGSMSGDDIPKILITSLASKRSRFSSRLAQARAYSRSQSHTTAGTDSPSSASTSGIQSPLSQEDCEVELGSMRAAVVNALNSSKSSAIDMADLAAAIDKITAASSSGGEVSEPLVVVRPPQERTHSGSFRSSGRRYTK
mmetsp:Transcript_28723/g.66666  ORF Transcript_28723/g.66666 Transcript_28723/m.66666 type:complete len:169 (+) Transcript_28723:160-666(+)|eukprot:CAMPEP_0178421212 /NCGR_PEP_ID=MMETSP0689_2-20121128/26532_1 /TAXON_ID=160604 /ORGANISM="Amphidinium massartii, Strain CS-259" /LENGTH=168 /DNA_ID=CAMNT_0020042719 /DNA_START=132 /DNA_END=638 /DNA_ORIENTATION=+